VFFRHLLLLLIVNGQIFEDASSFRGELKILARQTVESEYSLFFPIDVGHNSRDALQYTTEQVEFYLENGRFLRGKELDAEVNASALLTVYLTIGTITGAYNEHST
jgi:hypothetical protein